MELCEMRYSKLIDEGLWDELVFFSSIAGCHLCMRKSLAHSKWKSSRITNMEHSKKYHFFYIKCRIVAAMHGTTHRFCSVCMIFSSSWKFKVCGVVTDGAPVLSHEAYGGSSWACPMSWVGAIISPPCLRQQCTLHAALIPIVRSRSLKMFVF